MKSEIRVWRRFKHAEEDAQDALADQVADEFLFELAGLDLFAAKRISQALVARGVRAEDLNSISEGKTASPMVRALGGLVLRGLWYALIRPFLVLAKLTRSPEFRQEIKVAFKRALRADVRATRHVRDVANRWAKGDVIHPQEFQAAKQQLLRILIKVVLIYFAGPQITGLFSGGIWHAISQLWVSADEIVLLLLDRPLNAVIKKLMSAPTGPD